MPWGTIAAGVAKLLAAFMGWLEARQLLKAGEKAQIADSLRFTLETISKGKAAADEVRDNPDGEYARRLRERTRRPD